MKAVDFEALVEQATGMAPATLGPRAVESAVKRRMQACRVDARVEYWKLAQQSAAELQALVDEVVVPETWFFREREAFAMLAQEARAKAQHAAAREPLRLLSLPCSTGEEPYSMAMSLLDAGLAERQFRIDAVDISVRSLARAQLASYGRNSFRGRHVDFRDRYFSAEGGAFRLADRVRHQVRFHQANMLDLQFAPPSESYDFVFCRNVLIYFDRATQQRAVLVLKRLLKADGVLFVGPSEANLLLEHDFVAGQWPLAFAMLKRPTASRKAAPAKPPTPLKAPARKLHAPSPAAAAKPLSKPIGLALPALRPEPAAAPAEEDPLKAIARLADEGQLAVAMQRCEALAGQGRPSPDLLHLMGLLHDASGRPDQAEQCYRKALFLQPEHHDSMVHLAALLEHRGRADAARPLRRRLVRLGA